MFGEPNYSELIFQEWLCIVHNKGNDFLLKFSSLIVASPVSTEKLVCHTKVRV